MAPVTVESTGTINAIDVTSVESTTILTAEQIAKINQGEAASEMAERREAEASARASYDREKTAARAAMADSTAAAAQARNQASGFAGDPDKAEADFQRRPSDWLDHIRQLRDRGDDTAARTSLKDFRKRYPDYVIPSDLTRLLEP